MINLLITILKFSVDLILMYRKYSFRFLIKLIIPEIYNGFQHRLHVSFTLRIKYLKSLINE